MTASPDGTTKTKVMEAALRTFADKGYAAASIRDIAALAGVTKPMVYYHFGSKAGLYQALLDHCLDISHEALTEAARGTTVREQLVRFIRTMVTLAQSNQDRIRVVVQTYSTAQGQIPEGIEFRARLKERFERLKGILQHGIDSGELKATDANLMALSIMGQTNFIMTSLLLFGPGQPAPEKPVPANLAEAIVELFLRGAQQAAQTQDGASVAGVA